MRYRAWLPMFGMLLCLVSGRIAGGEVPSTESLLIAGGDLLHVVVIDVPELEEHVRVLDAGTIDLALIGTVHVVGETPASAGAMIAKALQQGRFILKPHVDVQVEQYAAANVSVSGQVLHPGSYVMNGPRDLMDVLSLAGGILPTADVHITIKRRGSTRETITVTIPNDPDVDILNSVKVSPGDLVIVPKAGIVYVLGDVARPGAYVMQNDAQLTVLQALALAAGVTKTSAENRARLVRQTATGPLETPLLLRDMQQGKLADVLLHPQDVIYVPYSAAKNLALNAAAILSSTSGAAIYAIH